MTSSGTNYTNAQKASSDLALIFSAESGEKIRKANQHINLFLFASFITGVGTKNPILAAPLAFMFFFPDSIKSFATKLKEKDITLAKQIYAENLGRVIESECGSQALQDFIEVAARNGEKHLIECLHEAILECFETEDAFQLINITAQITAEDLGIDLNEPVNELALHRRLMDLDINLGKDIKIPKAPKKISTEYSQEYIAA